MEGAASANVKARGITLALVHFQPIELYPPAMNDIAFLDADARFAEIVVFTNRNTRTGYAFTGHSRKTRIRRYANIAAPNAFLRYCAYLWFYVRTLLGLAYYRPKAIMYFETLSSFPVLLYRLLGARRVKVLAHNHEFVSLSDYARAMRLERSFHKLERLQYPAFAWISHTNQDRLARFISEHAEVPVGRTFALPNYPPRSWQRRRTRDTISTPVRVVYFGALGVSAMYVREFADWVVRQNGRLVWDIYSHQVEPDAVRYVESLRSPFIRFKGNVDYPRIPELLPEYDVGVILYKGTTENYVLNAPNKLFEYLSGDVDVWFPQQMTTSLAYVTTSTYPKVVPLDFGALDGYVLEDLVNRRGLTYAPSKYYSETVLRQLADAAA